VGIRRAIGDFRLFRGGEGRRGKQEISPKKEEEIEDKGPISRPKRQRLEKNSRTRLKCLSKNKKRGIGAATYREKNRLRGKKKTGAHDTWGSRRT